MRGGGRKRRECGQGRRRERLKGVDKRRKEGGRERGHRKYKPAANNTRARKRES